MALASVALEMARTHLNDEQGSLWQDYKLLPKLRAAYRELLNEFEVAGIPIINAVTAIITVPALLTDDANLDMSTVVGYPTNMLEPISLKERSVGQMNADFVNMQNVDFIPNIQKNNQLNWWSWITGTIFLLGALQANQVQMRYKRVLTAPKTVNDDLVVPLAETFLGAETAYMALISTPNFNSDIADRLKAIGERNLDNVIRDAIKGLQDLPARRRGYHRGPGRSRSLRDV